MLEDLKSQHIFNGMRRGKHPINQDASSLWDASNIRLTARDGESLSSLTNEKASVAFTKFYAIDGYTCHYMGHALLNEYLVTLVHYEGDDDTVDVIYRTDMSSLAAGGGTDDNKVLYVGDLGLDAAHPAQCVADFEATLVQKVYWVDGVNRPRMINIAKPELKDAEYDDSMAFGTIPTGYTDVYNDAPFDFVPTMTLDESVTVERVSTSSGGIFPAGTIQYVLTYSFKYGQETNPFHQSDLLYISYPDRGAEADDSVYCAFKITVSNIERRFDYVNIYSVKRTSINGTPVVQLVKSLEIGEDTTTTLTFTDTNTTGEDVDSGRILYESKDIIADNIFAKDGTLFLGDITYNRPSVKDVVGDEIARSLSVTTKTITYDGGKGINSNYQWINQLSKNSSYFKGGEYYRLGVQFQWETGEWSEPVYLEDYQMDMSARPAFSVSETGYTLTLPCIQAKLTGVQAALYAAGYRKARGVVVYPDTFEREVIAQGVICPTVFQSHARDLNAPHSFSSWFMRPMGVEPTGQTNNGLDGTIVEWRHFAPLRAGASSAVEIQNMLIAEPRANTKYGNDSEYKEYSESLYATADWDDFWTGIINDDLGTSYSADDLKKRVHFEDVTNYDTEHGYVTSEIAERYGNLKYISQGILGDYSSTFNFWYVDWGVCTFHSPEVEFDDGVQQIIDGSDNLSLRIVGMAQFDSCLSYTDLTLESPQLDPDCQGDMTCPATNTINGGAGIVAGMFFKDSMLDDYEDGVFELACYADKDSAHGKRAWMVYPWHREGSLNNDFNRPEGAGTQTAKLETKGLSNLRVSNSNLWFDYTGIVDKLGDDNPLDLDIADMQLYLSDDNCLMRKLADAYNNYGDILYYGDTDYLAVSYTPFKLACGASRTNSTLIGLPESGDEWTITGTITQKVYTLDGTLVQTSSAASFSGLSLTTVSSTSAGTDDDGSTIYSIQSTWNDGTTFSAFYYEAFDVYTTVPAVGSTVTLYRATLTQAIVDSEGNSVSESAVTVLNIPLVVTAVSSTESGAYVITARWDSEENLSGLQYEATDSEGNVTLEDGLNLCGNTFTITLYTDGTTTVTTEEAYVETTSNYTYTYAITATSYTSVDEMTDTDVIATATLERSGVSLEGQTVTLNISQGSSSTTTSSAITVTTGYYMYVYDITVTGYTGITFNEASSLNTITGFSYTEPITYLERRESGLEETNGYLSYNLVDQDRSQTAICISRDPVRVRFKTTPHVVFAMNYTSGGGNYRKTVPVWGGYASDSDDVDYDADGGDGYVTRVASQYWMNANATSDSDTYAVDRGSVKVGSDLTSGTPYSDTQSYLWIAELTQENVTNRFGGTGKAALLANVWLPAGETTDITDDDSALTVTFSTGDTWFQRYDCLKTYPYSFEDTNQVTEIGSFMCETRYNIDGRTDRNRALLDNTNVSPENFNLMNDVYCQRNNFYTYSVLDDDYYKVTRYPSEFLWSETKTPGSTSDAWTRLPMATTIDLDGTKGALVRIEAFGNDVYAFQEKAVQKIGFNSRAIINAGDGVPVELAQNAKVDGYTLLAGNVGCQDKWGVLTTPGGLYFIDNNNHQLMRIQAASGGNAMLRLSETNGMRFWLKGNSCDMTWRWRADEEGKANGTRLCYDPAFQDVYLIPGIDADGTRRDALCYNESPLEAFTSRMSYGGCVMLSYDSKQYAYAHDYSDDGFGTLVLWQLYSGETSDYNTIFGKTFPFSFSFVFNVDNSRTKVVDTVEMRADCYDYDEDEGKEELVGDTWNIARQDGQPFDFIRAYNEYQDTGKVSVDAMLLRKKFRVWRVQVPRGEDSRERIRNPWAMITLGKDDPGTSLTILHDLLVGYTPG